MTSLRPMRQKGLTLVELIIVIVLVGILAATAGPRIFGKAGVEEVTLQGQLMSLLRLQQQRAMQDTIQDCYGVNFSATTVNPVDCGSLVAPERILAIPSALSVAVVSSVPNASNGIRFNSLGCPVSTAHASTPEWCGNAPIELEIQGVNPRYICIQSQGYIRQGQCTT
ncbi:MULTISPECIES: type IV pilin protein [Idiomarina]|uniref:type IV pilin protein n=1 Tax=Idiomarina TaxID=135575 RepID=UPI00129C731A|nr:MULTISPECIES: type II secretion system protein [Idiomarina]MRJ42031.1 prepilin-type N-terminal cleavage/methylation domain-containing protein [Idiomarina sp. FeN1]NCU57314.1 prepilin-type N-terminal cleavage/methylation domain-containing protein [Idiomarina sp. FenA--70]NCU60022.1 prepilin-type N-terminal cleavage/methylation domain-containing protein [Idiomarina sp. FenBw--71]UUN12929.1 type II secretion system protein [Idiomarina loihiensis]